MFNTSLGRVWRSKSGVEGQAHQGQKRHFSAISEARVRFMFAKTSLASSLLTYLLKGCSIVKKIVI